MRNRSKWDTPRYSHMIPIAKPDALSLCHLCDGIAARTDENARAKTCCTLDHTYRCARVRNLILKQAMHSHEEYCAILATEQRP